MVTGNSIKTIISIKDEALELSGDTVKEYHLSIQLGLTGFSFSILDLARNKYMVLKSFSFLKRKTATEVLITLEKILLEENILNQPFKTVNIAYYGKKAVLVPRPLFDKEKAKEFLRYNAEITESENIFFDPFKNIEAVNVFAFGPEFETWIKSHFPTAKIIHYSTSLIDNLLGLNKNTLTSAALFVHVGEYSFDVVLIDKKELLYYNSFDYQSSEDFVYFLLFVCEQLKLNPENVPLKLLGEIEKNSALYAVICKYIRDVDFIERNDSFQYSYGFYEIPNHFYFVLLNQCLIN